MAPPGFFGTEVLYAPDFWVPMSMEPQIEPGNDWLKERTTWDCWMLGRPKPGVSWREAQRERPSGEPPGWTAGAEERTLVAQISTLGIARPSRSSADRAFRDAAVGSVLVVRSLQNALRVNVGFNPQNAASVSFDLQLYSPERGRVFQKSLLEKVQAVPGIESASLANTIPLSLDVSRTGLHAYGARAEKAGDMTMAVYYYAGRDFFRTLGTGILEGRDFSWRDNAKAPLVVIINRALAGRLFPHGDALGQRIA
ncbi:MAG TPA: ABC transporter permease [Bryobacteraceae bacterium]|nr:ABC transporter permease [Bryobacteraceae bacterium]